MTPVTIHERTFQYGILILGLLEKIRTSSGSFMLRNQLARSATSIGANIIEAQHASSKKQFLQYIQVALRSSRESEYWLRITLSQKMLPGEVTGKALQENCEISKILATILIRGKSNQ